MIRNIEKLMEKNENKIPAYAVHSKDQIKGFFGPYRFLSNFFIAPVFFEAMVYRTSENAYQAAKTQDTTLRFLFQNCEPWEAKDKGGKNGLLAERKAFRKDWEDVKTEIMCVIVFDKFARNRDLRDKLLETGLRHLEEANSWGDKVWGTVDGEGENRLGRILMNVRSFWQKQRLT
jgi:ribA/ribD-fused uncharacterized protein